MLKDSMSDKTSTLLIMGYPYLTEEVFDAHFFGKSGTIIYDPFDPRMNHLFLNHSFKPSTKEIINQCSYKPSWIRDSSEGASRLFFIHEVMKNLTQWKNSIIEDINRINPANIIMITDQFASSQIILEHFREKNIILVQPCLIDAWIREDKRSFYRKFLNFILRTKFFPSQQYWGLEYKDSKLLIYDKEIANFFQKMGREHHIIFNPLRDYFNKTILSKRKHPESGNSLNIGLYPVNYSTVYSDEYHKVFLDSYSKLYNKLKAIGHKIIVKIHPHESSSEWSNIFDKEDIVKNMPKNILLSKIDIQISTFSNSSIESFFSGAYTINFEPMYQDSPRNDLLKSIFNNHTNNYSTKIQDVISNITYFSNLTSSEKKNEIDNKLAIFDSNRKQLKDFLI